MQVQLEGLLVLATAILEVEGLQELLVEVLVPQLL